MANTLALKRSSVPGKVPTTADLALGEIAINTYDGKAYMKKNVSGTETIVQIGGGAGSGDVVGPSSATNGAIALFDGTTGKLLKNGSVPGTMHTQNANAVAITGGTVNAVTLDTNYIRASAYNVGSMNLSSIRGYGGVTTVNSTTYAINVDNSVKFGLVSFGSGSGCMFICDYVSNVITILGPNSNGTLVNTNSPASNQMGIYKSAFSHTIYLVTGSAAATAFGGWSLSMLFSTAS